jgi:hypothetical protein
VIDKTWSGCTDNEFCASPPGNEGIHAKEASGMELPRGEEFSDDTD